MTKLTPSPVIPKTRLPSVIYVVTAGTFLMGTTEFVVAGLLPEMAADFDTTVARAGLSITVFAIGMIFGAPLMALLTLRLPRRATLTLALVLFAIGHMTGALSSNFGVLLAARRALVDGDRSAARRHLAEHRARFGEGTLAQVRDEIVRELDSGVIDPHVRGDSASRNPR